MANLKFLFFALIIYLSTVQCYTQNNSLSIAAYGGQNYSSMRGTSYIDDNHTIKTGFLGGLLVNYKISDIISFQTELVFERKGSSSDGYEIKDIDNYSLGFLYGGDYHYDYLKIPILLNLSIGRNLIFSLNAGTYFSYLVNQNDDYSSVVFSNEQNMYPAKSLDFGIVTGLGLEIPLNNNVSMLFEGRNNFGLFDIGDIPAFYDHGSIKHNSIVITGGLKYHL